MKNYLMIAALALTLAACKKNEPLVPVSGQSKTAIFSSAVADPAANPANPFDDAGRLHNSALSYVLTHIKSIDQSRVDEVLKVTSRYVADSLKSTLPDRAIDAAKALIADDQHQYENEIDRAPLSETAKQYAQVLVKIFSGGDGSLDQFKSTIVALEARIIADKTLDEQERKSLLSATSVARYSLYFWMHSPSLPARLNIFVAAHDAVGTLVGGFSFGAFASAAARAVVKQDWGFFTD